MNSTKIWIASIAIGLGAAAGCGTDVHATASGVFPAEGFAGRTVRVEVSGDQTNWGAGATVDFGAGITVNSVDVASPTDLFAEITIDPTATLGKQDVTVNSGGKFTLKSAFEIVSPIEIQFTGNLAQGSLALYKIINHDFDNPFDGTQGTDPQTGATIYPNLLITGPTGLDLMSPLTSGSFAVAPYEIDGLALIDTDAMSGTVTLTSGPASKQVTSSYPSVTVATRAATDASGASTNGMIAMANDSQLFKLASGTAPTLVRASVTTQSADGQPTVALLGPSGHWSDFLAAGTATYGIGVDSGAPYAVVFDLSGAMGYQFTLAPVVETIATANEGTDSTNGTNTGASVINVAGVPFMQLNGTVSSGSDVDIVKLVVATGSPLIGKVFHVTTLNGGQDPFTALTVDVSAGNTSIAPGGAPQPAADAFSCAFGGVCGVDFLTDSAKPIAVGTYYFTVAADTGWSSSDTKYTLLFWVE